MGPQLARLCHLLQLSPISSSPYPMQALHSGQALSSRIPMANLQQVSIRMAPDLLQHDLMVSLLSPHMVLLPVPAIKTRLQVLAPLQELGMGKEVVGISSRSSNSQVLMAHHQLAAPMGQAGLATSMALHKGPGALTGNQQPTTGLATLPLPAMKRLPRLCLSTA